MYIHVFERHRHASSKYNKDLLKEIEGISVFYKYILLFTGDQTQGLTHNINSPLNYTHLCDFE